jgi:ComF family protein
MLLTPLLSLLAPHECLGCNAEGLLVCGDCSRALPPAVPRCYGCHRADLLFKTCTVCRKQSDLYSVHAAVRYEGIAKDLIWKLKFGRARAAADEIAAILAVKTDFAGPKAVIITHAPTATNRVRQRGYDQAALIAKALARKHKVPYMPLLLRLTKHKQVGATRAMRASQLSDAFRPIHAKHIKDAHIILIDDVVTTGATLQAAAVTLKAAGARRVEAIVFAQA